MVSLTETAAGGADGAVGYGAGAWDGTVLHPGEGGAY